MPETTKALELIQSFTLSLTAAKTIDEICWELTKNVIAHLGFEDCVVYLFDSTKQVLVQKAAHGPKNPEHLDILNPITIEPGEGIVGSVFSSGQYEIVSDTSKDSRYIVDDEMRLSEIAVPLLSRGKAIGVIDSEHSEANFYTKKHLTLLSTLASITANKIVETKAFIQLEKLNYQLQLNQESLIDKNQQLKTLNEQMDELIYRLSHDIRSPIIAIVSLINVLELAPEQLNHLLPMAKSNLTKMDWVLRNIYYYSDSVRRSIKIEKINFDELLQSAIQAVNEIDHTPTKVDFVNLDQIELYTDAWALHIFLVNLIHNSLTFANIKDSLHPELKLELYKIGNKTVLEFTDKGPGLPSTYEFKANQMFQRGSPKSKGAGFGFFLCQSISEKIKAKFQVENSTNGLRVTLTFP